jgi:CoA:oxalate CoA-transferase
MRGSDAVASKPLEGIRVLGFEIQVAGPYCTMMLADQGAEVIKIERPGTGDTSREMAPIIANERGEKNSGYFLRFNRNKKGITLDVQKEEGRKVFMDLIRVSDVLVENFRPGLMKKLGLDWDVLREVNPKLIYARISGFGTMPGYIGPYSDRPAYDIIAQAMGGLMYTCGQRGGPPTWLGIALGDIYSGVLAAQGILLALIQREKTGRGQFIDVSMYDAMVSLAERSITAYSLTGQIMERGRERFIAPWGPFRVKDGWVALIVATEADWAKFCKAIGREDLIGHPRASSGPVRAENMDDFLGPIIDDWMMQHTKEEVVETLLAAGLPVGSVQNAKEIFECRHVAARKMLIEVEDPVLGPIKLVGPALKMSESPEAIANPAPLLGQHTQEVLTGVLGYSPQRIQELKGQGII